MTNLHTQAGMFGALIIETKEDAIKKAIPYSRDYTLRLSEVDTTYVEQQMQEMLRMMGWFTHTETFLNAIQNDYIPHDVSSQRGKNPRPNFNYFMINGMSYPMTEPLQIKMGENTRVRLIGAGALPHFMYLPGHAFWHVCQDRAPLQSPVRPNAIPIFPGSTGDIIIQGTNPGMWHFNDPSDLSSTNNGIFPDGVMNSNCPLSVRILKRPFPTKGFKIKGECESRERTKRGSLRTGCSLSNSPFIL